MPPGTSEGSSLLEGGQRGEQPAMTPKASNARVGLGVLSSFLLFTFPHPQT